MLNSVGAHIFTNTLRQLLATSTELRHLRFQFVDTLNDEVGKIRARKGSMPGIRSVLNS